MEIINKFFWYIATILIIGSSFYFSWILKFPQFNIRKMFKILIKKEKQSGITSFKALMMTLGGKIGVGSIAGVALGICYGGPGTIFWLWVIAILSSVLAYCETILGITYRKKIEKDYIGGPFYYIRDGLRFNKLSILYAFLVFICYIGGFLSIQSNTIVKSINDKFLFSPTILGILLALITFLFIFKGIKKISDVSGKLVPIMTILYLLVVFIIMCFNYNSILNIFISIIKSAFNSSSIKGGIISIVIIGIQRGIFSSEAGIGTASIAASSASSSNPDNQGYLQMLGVYITSLLICTATTILVMLSPYKEISLVDLNGIEIVNHIFTYYFGSFGHLILIIFIFMFSFSTILTGYYYGECCLVFLFKRLGKIHLICLKVITCFLIFLGSIISSTIIWLLVDVLVAFLSIINIIAMFLLKKDIVLVHNCYKS